MGANGIMFKKKILWQFLVIYGGATDDEAWRCSGFSRLSCGMDACEKLKEPN